MTSIQEWERRARESQRASLQRRSEPDVRLLPRTTREWSVVLVVCALVVGLGLMLAGLDLR